MSSIEDDYDRILMNITSLSLLESKILSFEKNSQLLAIYIDAAFQIVLRSQSALYQKDASPLFCC